MIRCPACQTICADAYSYCVACGTDLAGVAAKQAEADPILGATLPGGYRVTHLVGIGGMGHVYSAEQVALGRTVAVKVVHPHLANDELAAARFLNEARAASRLSHPNSVAIFDFGRTTDGYPYIVMEYLRGRDLARVALADGPLPFRRVVNILHQTLAALDEAHALGILHRDVKPDNIVLEPLRSSGDFVKVVDFGLAKLLQEEPPSPRNGLLSRPGLVCGTPEYMSPEQARGDMLDGRSDLYSVGVVLYELLTGQLPFVGDTQTSTLLLHIGEPVPDPRRVARRPIPAPLAELTMRALAKNREDRLPSASAFADALEEALHQSEDRRSTEPGPVTAIRCATCGKLSPVGQKFCGECGLPISARAPSPIPPRVDPPPPTSQPAASRRAVPSRVSTPAQSDRASRQLQFFAREDVVRWLEARRGEALSLPAAAHVIGEAGMGKTRLLGEVAARWQAAGDTLVSVGPDPAWAKIADYTVCAAIVGLSGYTEEEIAARSWDNATREARRGLAVLFGSTPLVLPAHERRAAVAEALRWGLEQGAARRGDGVVVLMVDDLDYIDGTSRNAFADVIAEPSPVPALLVVAYGTTSRPVANPVPGEMWRLAPLPPESFSFLLPTRLGVSGAPLTPLHLEQLITWSRETTEAPPDQLVALISRRFDRLPLHARHVLHAFAVWGDGAKLETLARMVPTGTDIVSGLDAIEHARIATMGADGLFFQHPVLRRVAFSSVPAGRKHELFVRCAALRPDAPLELRAKHAMYGDSTFQALSLLDALGARRAAEGDLEGSVSALRHALEVSRRDLYQNELDDPLAAMLVFSRKLAEALAACRRWGDADGVLREALGNAPPTSEHRAHLLGMMAHVANARRHPGEARRYLDEAMRVARQSDARELLPMLENLEKAIAVA